MPVREAVQGKAFLWAVINPKMGVGALNTTAIRPVIEEVVRDKSAPANDMIGHDRKPR